MAQIECIQGDATYPVARGNKVIVHICNDIGAWGKGFVMALSKRWKAPEQSYREWHRSQTGFGLGEVQFVQVEPDIWVANMVSQQNIRSKLYGDTPIRYQALRACLQKVYVFSREYNATIHMPRIGTGLAGGNWIEIDRIIIEELCGKGISVTVYNLPQIQK